MPFWVTVTVDQAGKQAEAKSHTFDSRDEAYAELEKIKKAQQALREGNNPRRFDDALSELPSWLMVHNVSAIVSASVEGSG